MIESVVSKFEEEYIHIMEGKFDQELLNIFDAGRIRAALKKLLV